MVEEIEIIEEKFLSVTKESDNANQVLSDLENWGDAELDKALEQKDRFTELTSTLSVLNDSTIRAFNNNSEDAYGLLPAMRTLHEACDRNIKSLLGSKLSKALKSTIEKFQDEVDQLQENIDDFVNSRYQPPFDEEWDELLKQF